MIRSAYFALRMHCSIRRYSFSVRMAMQRVGLIDIGMCGLASEMFNGDKYSPP
jgi:hypothetical protein